MRFKNIGIVVVMLFATCFMTAQDNGAKLAMDANQVVGNPEAATPNDDCAMAEEITSFGTIIVDITDNTVDITDPGFSCQLIITDFSQSTWYVFTAIEDGTVDISTCATGNDGLLGLYTGTCGAFTEVACGEDDCGLNPEILGFAVTAGETYYICYADWGGPSGGLTQIEVSGTGIFAVEVVPTLGEWAIISLALLMMIFGIIAVRQAPQVQLQRS